MLRWKEESRRETRCRRENLENNLRDYRLALGPQRPAHVTGSRLSGKGNKSREMVVGQSQKTRTQVTRRENTAYMNLFRFNVSR